VLSPVACAAPAGSTCASWCIRDALGQSHCGHADCLGCDICTRQVACTPTSKDDLTLESCEQWCKVEHAKTHCVACACRSCSFCSVRAAQEGSSKSQEAASPFSPIGATGSQPPQSADAREEALDVLRALDAILTDKNKTWEDAFRPFDRKGNGVVSSSEVQRVFHMNGAKSLPLHGLPSTVVTLHGIDTHALKSMVPHGYGDGSLKHSIVTPPSESVATAIDTEAMSSLRAVLKHFNERLEDGEESWSDAFHAFERDGGLVGLSDLESVFSKYGVSIVPLRHLPANVTTLHGVDYHALAALAPGGEV